MPKRGKHPAVSSLGRKRNFAGVIRKPSPRRDGYVLCQVKDVSNTLMHIFVCSLFHGPRPGPNYTVEHKDGDRSNNNKDNLKWATWQEQHKNKQFRSDAWKTSEGVSHHDEVWVALGIRECAVSNYGRWKNTYGKISTPHPMTDGYVGVTMLHKHHKLHDLVCTAFHGPKPTIRHTANHKNHDRSDNRAENLEWMSPKEQNQDRADRKGVPHTTQRKAIRGRKRDEVEWIAYESANDAARKLSLSPGNVCGCANGRAKHHGGYEFQWITTDSEIEGEEWKDIIVSEWAPGGIFSYREA